MQSLQSKLGGGLLISLIIIFTALWLLVSLSIQSLAEDYITSRLQHDAETLLSSIKLNKKNQLEINNIRIDQIYSQPFSGHYYVILTDKQSFASRSLWDTTLNTTPVNTGQKTTTIQTGPEEQALLLLSIGYKKYGIPLTIVVAEDLNPINDNIHQFKYWFAIVSSGMLFILVTLQIFILHKSLKPLNKTQNELIKLQQGQLQKLDTNAPSELQPLINEVNHLLDVMQRRLLRSRDALSDLAHAIKAPLTVIKQVSENNNFNEYDKNLLLKQTDYIYQISDHILKRAQVAGSTPGSTYSGAIFSFQHDLPDLINTLKMMYPDKTIQFINNINENTINHIDRQDMLELMGNLLDNACKWAQQTVLLTVQSDIHLHICIEDDGTGADPEKISALSQRGVRLDEKMTGHGFGLAISTDIVNDYKGDVDFNRSDKLGGFKVDISLPLKS